jgi:hypothetical protein
MLDEESLNHVVEYFLLRNIKWKFKEGPTRIPTRAELKILLDDCIQTVQESEVSISVEIGSVLVKRTDDHIDIYVHAGELRDYERDISV